MQKLQDSAFSLVKTTNLSPAVFSFLQPTEESSDKTPLGGILSNAKLGWLALGPKFCVVDLRTGLKVAAHTFGAALSNFNTTVASVVELPTPLTHKSHQLLISLECEDVAGMICVFHINGSQILRSIQTDMVFAKLAVCDGMPDGPLMCFDGVVMGGTVTGEIIAFDLNRASLIQALNNIADGNDELVRNEINSAYLTILPLSAVQKIEQQRHLAIENDDHIAVVLNEDSRVDNQYVFRNPDGTIRMKAKRDHIRVSAIEYIPQLGSLIVGFNFGAFQIWNLMTLDLEFTSQVNVECMPVTNFGFQEPCDDPRAFCYLWVIFSLIDRFEEEVFPLAVMYSLTYQGKRMLSDTKCLYQEFSIATIRFQIELGSIEDSDGLVGGRCVSCLTYSVSSTLGEEGEDTMLNLCHIVWECWGENSTSPMLYGMLLFDLDQWYKDQMPATYQLESSPFMSTTRCTELSRGACCTLHVRLDPASVLPYTHATRLEEHFYPNSLQYDIICLNTSEACVLSTAGIQRQIVFALEAAGPAALLQPRLFAACRAAGLAPLYQPSMHEPALEEQRSFLLSVALEARLSRFLKRCAHDWATGSHAGVGCTLTFLVDWCWKRALELKENAKELTAPLFISSALPDRNVIRCLEHCVQQLTQLTGLLDSILTKCCNLIVPDVLNEVEERYRALGAVSQYFQLLQWLVRAGLLPERPERPYALLADTYCNRRTKLNRLHEKSADENDAYKPCPLLYIDQLIEHEFGGERIRQMWIKGGSDWHGLYPPPSLYSLLRLYLLPDVAEEHKHSLVLYLLVDYSMLYDDAENEGVIRRLMQFPTMFGLSNTAIKATQAFWHLDHRDFDFALDQLQCLTGNTLSDWQHNVVLSSLLAQKKTQAALQYLHVRKPVPFQNQTVSCNRVNDHDKLEDWQSCCNLYLARHLVYEALDVVRMCVKNCGSIENKVQVLNFFFKGCRNTGQLAKLLQVTLMPFEEEVFIKYLENCNDQQTSDVLLMYYLQQARYLEAQQYHNKIKQIKLRNREVNASAESFLEGMDRETARDTIIEVVCSSIPNIANRVAACAMNDMDAQPRVIAPKPMSVFVQAISPKNTLTYKSTFIQDTIDSASETWMNKTKTRRGYKRALDIEDTPFICTPKLSRSKSVFKFTSESIDSESTPPKRARLDVSPMSNSCARARPACTSRADVSAMLDMPLVHTPEDKYKYDRSGADTPHSILKSRRYGLERAGAASSPVDLRFLADSDDDLETSSNHTLASDYTNKHLRFTIPTASERGSTPSPLFLTPSQTRETEQHSYVTEKDMPVTNESYASISERITNEIHPLESPPKKLASEEKIHSRKSYKDTVRARLSMSANSSLSDDPNASVESIADIPVTLINPRYTRRMSREKDDANRTSEKETNEKLTTSIRSEKVLKAPSVRENDDSYMQYVEKGPSVVDVLPPRTPSVRKGIRSVSENATLLNRSRSVTPERPDSPTSMLRVRRARSRSVTPESSPLAAIPEQSAAEVDDSPPQTTKLLHVSHAIKTRSRSRTPERADKVIADSPRLEPITESPPASPVLRSHRSRSRTPERVEKMAINSPVLEAVPETPHKHDSPLPSPRRSTRSRSRTPEVEFPKKAETAICTPESPRTLRSRSRTPEVEFPNKGETAICTPESPRTLRSRSKTPEKLMSPKTERSIKSKSLSRLVLEANTFAKKKPTVDNNEPEEGEISRKDEITIECTPMKTTKEKPLLDATFSPIVNKSLLQSSADSACTDKQINESHMKPLPAFTTINESYFQKSVLHSYESSIAEATESSMAVDESKIEECKNETAENTSPGVTTINETFGRSVLHSYQSSVAGSSSIQETSVTKEVKTTTSEMSILKDVSSLMTSDSEMEIKEDNIQKEKETIVEIEREINEIEGDMSEDSDINDEENEDDELDDEDNSEEELTEEESEPSTPEVDEVISIRDTDSEDTSGSGRLEICEEQSSDTSDHQSDVENEPLIMEDLKLGEELPEERIEDHPKFEIETDPPEPNDKLEASASKIYRENVTTKTTEIAEEKLQSQKSKEMDLVIEVNIENEAEILDVVKGSSNNLLNQTGLSIMTDDNSVLESDRSSIILNITDDEMMKVYENAEKVGPTEVEVKENQHIATENLTDHNQSIKIPIEPETPAKTIRKRTQSSNKPETDIVKQIQTTEEYVDEMPQVKQLTKHTKSTSSNKSELETTKEIKSQESLNVNAPQEAIESTRKRTKSTSSNKSVSQTAKEIQLQEVTKENMDKKNIEEIKPTRQRAKSISSDKSMFEFTKEVESLESMDENVDKEVIQADKSTRKRTKSTSSNKSVTERAINIQSQVVTNANVDEEMLLAHKPTRLRSESSKGIQPQKIITDNVDKEMLQTIILDTQHTQPIKLVTETAKEIISHEIINENVDEEMASVSKETKSTSSNIAASETVPEIEEPKTPMTRKRSRSIASNISEPEVASPGSSKRQVKTPNSETRKIMTRRASKELSKSDVSDTSIVEETLTPRRRSTRIRSKADDNSSIASDNSIISSKSKVSESDPDTKPAQVRRGRKSILSTKPDLSVIPESAVEDSSRPDESDSVIHDYSTSRRLTRKQKALLMSMGASPVRRLASPSPSSSVSIDIDDTLSELDQPTIDRIGLLNKRDFEGTPDTDEYHLRGSPDSFASDVSSQRRARLGRSASESRITPKKSAAARRVSVDIVPDQVRKAAEGAALGRRASFHRALEALHTPNKGRRASADFKNNEESEVTSGASASPASSSPLAIARRPSTATSDTSRRSKKMPAIEEK